LFLVLERRVRARRVVRKHARPKRAVPRAVLVRAVNHGAAAGQVEHKRAPRRQLPREARPGVLRNHLPAHDVGARKLQRDSAAMQRWAANRARANAGPTLIEFFTYRAEGHSTSDDPSGYRSAQERSEWPLGDPVMRLKNHLIALGEWDEERQEKMDLEAAEHVKKVTKEAEANGILGHGLHHPFRTMFEDVFEELPWHLREQADQAVHERKTKFPEGLPEA